MSFESFECFECEVGRSRGELMGRDPLVAPLRARVRVSGRMEMQR
jgi:hypothetical protein